MSKKKTFSDVQEFSRVTGSVHYRDATDFSSGSFGDARNGLIYALHRLSILGLTVQDREPLRELARLAFQESDVTEAANEIKSRESASPLAVAIADIVAASFSRGGKEMTKMAMLGAVYGAYAGLKDGRLPEDERVIKGIQGAIAGAVAVSTSKFIQDHIEVEQWREFAEKEIR